MNVVSHNILERTIKEPFIVQSDNRQYYVLRDGADGKFDYAVFELNQNEPTLIENQETRATEIIKMLEETGGKKQRRKRSKPTEQ